MSDNKNLESLRARIDELDDQLLTLISRRAALAQEVARVKEALGNGGSCYRPEREAAILRKVIGANPGPLSGEEVARLFRELMSACLALEQPLTVAYLGPEGTFTQMAALKHFGHSVGTMALNAIDEVFREVEAGACNYGVVPVENSIEGVVNHTLDMFLNSPLQICGEVALRIHHHLLGAEGLQPEAVRRVYAHQQALAQCREWLDSHVPGCERIAVSSNAEAARIVAQESGVAAIAGETAAGIYSLSVLASNIEDEPDNTTRFLVIGRQGVPPSGSDKTSLLVSGPNRPGLLYELLEPLASKGISMTRLESRPSRRALWEYVFFIDIEGHAEDPGVAAALAQLRGEAYVLKVLGSYPRAAL